VSWVQVWNVLGVLNYLQALIDKSGIVETLEKVRASVFVVWALHSRCLSHHSRRARHSCVNPECASARCSQERQGEVGFSANEGYDYASSNVLRLLVGSPPPFPWVAWLGRALHPRLSGTTQRQKKRLASDEVRHALS
jgi:hypothetical protein